MVYLVFFLSFLLLLSVPPLIRAKKTTETAARYAKSYLTSYYYAHKDFPDNFTIPFYPYAEYQKGGSATNATGVPANQAWCKVVLAGEDRQFGTPDDVVITLTASELEKDAFEETMRRARILEQAAYSVCLRRLSEGKTPIWPATLDDLVRAAQLPPEYETTPFGQKYIYDPSRCKPDSCDCGNQTIVWAGTLACTPPYTLNTATYRCETSPTCPTGGTYDPLNDDCEASPVCPPGGTYNPATDRCEATPTVSCPTGSTYDSATGYCEVPATGSWVCSLNGNSYPTQADCQSNCYQPGKWYPIYGTCTYSSSCPTGFSPNGSVCVATPSVTCPVGYTYVSADGVCVAAASCPTGYTKSGTTCTAPATCPNGGELDTVSDVCWTD